MGRIILATIIGAVLLFAWNFVSWMVVKLHDGSMRSLEAEPLVVEMLRSADVEPGAYYFPAPPEDMKDQAAMDDFTARHRQGPLGMLIVSAGTEPMEPMMFVTGFALNVISVLIAALLLASAGIRHASGRVLFVAALGVLVTVVSDLSYWNWMRFPSDHSLAMVADNVIGWIFVGIALAALIRPKPATT